MPCEMKHMMEEDGMKLYHSKDCIIYLKWELRYMIMGFAFIKTHADECTFRHYILSPLPCLTLHITTHEGHG